LPHHAELAAGVVVDDDSQLYAVVEVLLDGFDHRDLAGQRDVHDVRLLLRPDADAIPDAQLDAEHHDAFDRRMRLCKRIPLAERFRVHEASS
jgi:hypothetical protein